MLTSKALRAIAAHRHGLHEGVIVKVNALSSAADVVMEEEEGDAEAQSIDQDIAAPADDSAAVSTTPVQPRLLF